MTPPPASGTRPSGAPPHRRSSKPASRSRARPTTSRTTGGASTPGLPNSPAPSAKPLETPRVRRAAVGHLQQACHGFGRMPPGAPPPQQVHARHDLGRIELFFLSGSALRDVDGRIDTPLGQLARQIELAVPRALE